MCTEVLKILLKQGKAEAVCENIYRILTLHG
jgi:hypothetical protein